MEVKQKRVKNIRPKLKLFRASEPEKSVLMWGVNYSLSQLSHVAPKAVLLADDFKASMKVSVSNHLYIKDHMPVNYKFKEYSPMVFQDLRRRFQITDEMMLESFVNHQPLRRVRPSKSDKSSFMLTWDKRFTAINLSSEQLETVQAFLEEYHAYIVSWQGKTRLPKWLALYRIQLGDKHTHILIVTNVFYPPGRVPWKFAFNLSLDPETEKKSSSVQMNSSTFLSEEQFQGTKHRLILGEADKQELWEVLKRDIKFLIDHNFSHYRLLLGVIGPLIAESVDCTGSALPGREPSGGARAATRLASSTEDERSTDSELSDNGENGLANSGGCAAVSAAGEMDAAWLETNEKKRMKSRDLGPDWGLLTSASGECTYYLGLYVSLKKVSGGSRSRRRSVVGLEAGDDTQPPNAPIASTFSMGTEEKVHQSKRNNNRLPDFFVKYVA